MDATHPRIGAEAGVGRLPAEVLRSILESLCAQNR
jgi:hypothetical protein